MQNRRIICEINASNDSNHVVVVGNDAIIHIFSFNNFNYYNLYAQTTPFILLLANLVHFDFFINVTLTNTKMFCIC